jgi:Ca2+-binding RTX toxin-like protein
MANAANSAELRTLIQNATSSDSVINLTSAAIYSVTTLGKTSSNLLEPALPYSGYTIQSSEALTPPAQGASTPDALTREFSNTRIYQQNIDGPYSPGLIKDVELIYSTGNDALLSATSGNFSLSNVRFTGTHSGWAGNGNLYFSLTTFDAAAPLNVPLSLNNVSVTINGQGNGFDGTTGGSAFLHSWNNNGPVSITNSIFDESGFASTLNLLGTGASPSGTYTIANNLFNRNTTAANRTVRPEGNRLQNVNATLTGNTFSDGSYLDLHGDISGITIGAAATTNTFNTIRDPNTSAPGYGIRITAPNTPVSTKTLIGTTVFTGSGLPLKYVNAAANTSYTLTGGTITVNGSAFTNLIAGGQAADTISGTANADWINGDDGADNISGLAGNDSLLGGAGNDTILGGDNNDTIEGGEGADSLNGGNGIDTLSYANSSAAVTVNLLTNTASGGDAAGDTISLFENLIGSANADSLTGNTAANIITGEAGADTLSGGSGSDTLDGGLGNDIIIGGTQADTLTGGLGRDRFVWRTTDGTDTITDFTTAQDDQMALADIFNNTAPNNNLAVADYATATTFLTVSNADDNKVIEITTSQTAGQIGINIAGLTNAYILVFNSTVGNAQLIFDTNWGDAGSRIVAANLTSINSLALTNAFTNTNFWII